MLVDEQQNGGPTTSASELSSDGHGEASASLRTTDGQGVIDEKPPSLEGDDAHLEEAIADGDVQPAPFPIVGIGASAGGLEALQAMVRRLRPDNMAYIVVQHLSPVHESLLAELLGRASELPVLTVTDGQKAEPGSIYVVPANADMTIRQGVL